MDERFRVMISFRVMASLFTPLCSFRQTACLNSSFQFVPWVWLEGKYHHQSKHGQHALVLMLVVVAIRQGGNGHDGQFSKNKSYVATARRKYARHLVISRSDPPDLRANQNCSNLRLSKYPLGELDVVGSVTVTDTIPQPMRTRGNAPPPLYNQWNLRYKKVANENDSKGNNPPQGENSLLK